MAKMYGGYNGYNIPASAVPIFPIMFVGLLADNEKLLFVL